jgi:hypothetical protein
MKELLLISTVPVAMILAATPVKAQFVPQQVAEACMAITDAEAVTAYVNGSGDSGGCVTARAEMAPFSSGQLLNSFYYYTNPENFAYGAYISVTNSWQPSTQVSVPGGTAYISCDVWDWVGAGEAEGAWGTYGLCGWSC